jgi:hypothetical protein
MKNEQDRLIVLNRVARSVVDSVRDQHPEYVFVRYPKPKEAKPVPLDSMNTTAWRMVACELRISGKSGPENRRRTGFAESGSTT